MDNNKILNLADMIEKKVYAEVFGKEYDGGGISNSMCIEYSKSNPKRYAEIVNECLREIGG